MKKFLAIFCAAFLMLALFAGCSERQNPSEEESSENSRRTSQPTVSEAKENNAQYDEADINLVQFQSTRGDDPIAVISTSMGEIRIRLFPDYAPLAVNNFIGLAQEGYYNGKLFHRVVNEFMIQGGALSTTDPGETIYKDEDGKSMPFADEFNMDLWHFRGALSMANSGADSNTCQFFIVQNTGLSESYLSSMEDIFPSKVIDKYAELGGSPNLDWKHTVFGMVIEGMDIVDEIAAVEVDASSKPVDEVIIESIVIENAGS